MFDHLDWWQVLLLLAPIVLVMKLVQRQEKRRGATLYPTLTPFQKTWVLLQQLPPSVSARFLLSLEVHELETYLKSGQSIKGTGLLLQEPVIKEFFKGFEAPRRDSDGGLQERLANAVLASPQMALQHMKKVWPLPDIDQPESVPSTPSCSV